MAPYSTEHLAHKKRVKFAHSRSPTPMRKKAKKAESYADIVLHYLSKLKNIFQISKNPENSEYPTGPILKASTNDIKRDPGDTQKAYAIIDAALQYGYNKNIIEKVGDYYLVKKNAAGVDSRGRSHRGPTPGPDYVRCRNCDSLSKTPSRHRLGSSKREHESGRKRRRSPSTDNASVNYCTKCYSRMRPSRKS